MLPERIMKLREIHQLAIKLAIEADIRGKKEVERQLKKSQEEFRELSKEKKKKFDLDRLTNLYLDSTILYGDPDRQVKTIIAGIDVTTADLLLADRLNERFHMGIDVVVSHHPEGKALAKLSTVMELQEDIYYRYGIPINVMNKFMDARSAEIHRAVHPLNHNQSVDAARLLDMPFVCLHTTSDNLVQRYIENFVKKYEKKLVTLGEWIDVLSTIPEYEKAIPIGSGPVLFVGSKKNKAGKVAVTEMTGGTSGAKETYEKLANAGVGTIISMHMREDYRKEAEKNSLNVIICGHIPSDSIGMNLFLDHLEAKVIKIIPFSGLIRVRRKI